MFHTELAYLSLAFAAFADVVIPWRGFRCFTHNLDEDRRGTVYEFEVVIPWRGFRCFTLIVTLFNGVAVVDVEL